MRKIYLFFFLLAFFPFSVRAESGLQITEIMYNPIDVDDGLEWIEIKNNGPESIDLTKSYFDDGDFHFLTKPPIHFGRGDLVLASGEIVILADDALKFASLYPLTQCDIIDTTMSLNNEMDTLRILDSQKQKMTEVGYWWGWGGDDNNFSLVNRFDRLSQSWLPGGSPCQDEIKSEAINIDKKEIFISEISPNPITGKEEFIELFNNSSEGVNLKGWQLDSQNEKGKPYILPDVVLKSKQTRVFYKHETKVNLADRWGMVILKDPFGNLADAGPLYLEVAEGKSLTRQGEVWLIGQPNPSSFLMSDN